MIWEQKKKNGRKKRIKNHLAPLQWFGADKLASPAWTVLILFIGMIT